MQNGIIICDECRVEIEQEQLEVWDRVITKDENGNDVVERYFDCPNCGKHYTVTVIDREMKLMIQKRRQIQKKIALGIRNRASEYVLRRYKQKDDELKEDLKYRENVLKEKYEKEIQA